MWKTLCASMIFFFLCTSWVCASNRDEEKIEKYISYIELHAKTRIEEKSFQEKIDILRNIKSLLAGDTLSGDEVVQFLLAFEIYMQTSIASEKISDRGYPVFDTVLLSEIQEDSFVLGSPDTELMWIVYSDLECPFCAQLYTQGTVEKIKETFPEKLTIVFQHFPLDFHASARGASEVLQCIGEIYGGENFYTMAQESYTQMGNNNFSMEKLYELAQGYSFDQDDINVCLEDEAIGEKIDKDMQRGVEYFGVNGTPGNILIHTLSGEYISFTGAYPFATFQQAITKLFR